MLAQPLGDFRQGEVVLPCRLVVDDTGHIAVAEPRECSAAIGRGAVSASPQIDEKPVREIGLRFLVAIRLRAEGLLLGRLRPCLRACQPGRLRLPGDVVGDPLLGRLGERGYRIGGLAHRLRLGLPLPARGRKFAEKGFAALRQRLQLLLLVFYHGKRLALRLVQRADDPVLQQRVEADARERLEQLRLLRPQAGDLRRGGLDDPGQPVLVRAKAEARLLYGLQCIESGDHRRPTTP